ncbi:MAG: malonyl-ACP O-methyltransferase BioC [Candidatus Accumulibacter sp.]|jgi:malonyl-CoA O-methyltransferase|nr:malonyl-ACP O-methyltransferase BioC [Accumulibacter sp.]
MHSLSIPIKRRVRDAFERAVATYDSAAVVQRRVGDRLLEKLAWTENGAPENILDAGCGTGDGAGRLHRRWPGARVTGVDFAPAMLALARKNADRCLAADIEKLPFAPASFGLWWSNLSIQWCDARAAFREAARVLEPGGRIAFSTLCPGTFAELRAAFSGIDRHRHTLHFSVPDDLRNALEQAGLGGIRLLRERHAVFYPDLRALLRSIKDIGAQNVGEEGRQGMMGRSAWRKAAAAYEQFRTPDGLPASYDVLLGYAEKCEDSRFS